MPNESFDYIYVNPPFLPIPPQIDFLICGNGGDNGLHLIHDILENANPFLSPNGSLIMFSQSLSYDTYLKYFTIQSLNYLNILLC